MSARLPAAFYAYIAVAFVNAFVDLGHKILIQNTLFRVYDGAEQVLYTNIVNGLILLPFVMFFTPAGWLADRFAKPLIMRRSAALAVVVTSLITVSYWQGWFWAAFGLTFVLATQSALYSPAKFGYIRELVGSGALSRANGWVQGATTAAILSGTLVFSFAFEKMLGGIDADTAPELITHFVPLGLILVAASIVEYTMARRLPQTTAVRGPAWSWSDYAAARNLQDTVSSVWKQRVLWLTIMGIGILTAIAQIVLVIFPAHAEAALGWDSVFEISGVIACAVVGMVIGAVIAGRAQGYIETGYVPIGAVLFAVAIGVLPWLSSAEALVIDFLLIGIAAGLYLVPLNALMQFHAPEGGAGRVIAANNFIGTLVMVGFVGVSAALSTLIDATGQLYILAVVAVLGAAYTLIKLPQSGLRLVLAAIVGLRYKLQVGGLRHLPVEGGVLLLGNHMSFIDWAVVQSACPRPIRFVMDGQIFRNPLLNWAFRAVGAIPVSRGDYKSSLKQVRELLLNGEVVCLFPEGTITATGHLLSFKRGFEQSVRGSGVPIVPFYLNGLWGSEFSRSQRLRSIGVGRRPLQVHFGDALSADSDAPTVKQAVMRAGRDSWVARAEGVAPLGVALLGALKKQPRRVAVNDALSGDLPRWRLAAGALRLAWWLRHNDTGERVGILLPPGSGSVLMNVAAWVAGRTVVNLNYSASLDAIIGAVERADLQRIYTAEAFLQRLEKRGLDVAALKSRIELKDLAELRKDFSSASLLPCAVATRLLPAGWLCRLCGNTSVNTDTAAVLFSSGSEGTPKGVELSHSAIAINCEQIVSVLQPVENERVLGALPGFHAFGLTATQVMPLLEGIPIVACPDPTDIATLGKRIAEHKATLVILTGTILRLLARHPKVDPVMLETVRLVVAGAEKLHPDVRSVFRQRFGHDILEGYGATEMAPVVSVNLPDRLIPGTAHVQSGHQPGSVGLPLPGALVRVVDPETHEALAAGEAGLVLLTGPQQMSGYLKDPERSAASFVEQDGMRWYCSGDQGRVDEDGYLTLIDRYARFAKLGGEMVSLTAVEQTLTSCHGDAGDTLFVAVAVSDVSKGEKVVVLHDQDLDTTTLRQAWRDAGHSTLMWPGAFIQVEAIPVLGAGKVDYQGAKQLAIAKLV